jgi:hypothetical protein
VQKVRKHLNRYLYHHRCEEEMLISKILKDQSQEEQEQLVEHLMLMPLKFRYHRYRRDHQEQLGEEELVAKELLRRLHRHCNRHDRQGEMLLQRI